VKLEPTEQRILGVLIEKELAVPDSYPLTENALLGGCNQKSNRDPVLVLEDFQLSGALASMLEKRILLRVSVSGSRTIRFKHQCDEVLGLNGREKAVLAELLLRGPQAPGALKPRVARMGMAATPAEILVVLEGLRARADGALVEQQPRRPRERDQRWTHLLGADAEGTDTPGGVILQPQPAAVPKTMSSSSLPFSEPAVPEPAVPELVLPEVASSGGLEDVLARMDRLERQVAELHVALARLRQRPADTDHADTDQM
jgi:uncharacterized protein YceH (UPF0502 family)